MKVTPEWLMLGPCAMVCFPGPMDLGCHTECHNDFMFVKSIDKTSCLPVNIYSSNSVPLNMDVKVKKVGFQMEKYCRSSQGKGWGNRRWDQAGKEYIWKLLF